MAAGNYDAAIQQYDAVLALDSANSDAVTGRAHAVETRRTSQILAHIGAANSFLTAGNALAALQQFKAALAIDPTNADALNGVSRARATFPHFTNFWNCFPATGSYCSDSASGRIFLTGFTLDYSDGHRAVFEHSQQGVYSSLDGGSITVYSDQTLTIHDPYSDMDQHCSITGSAFGSFKWGSCSSTYIV